MYFFEHGNPEELLLFVWNFNMNLVATGILEMDAEVQYLFRLVHGEDLLQFGLLYTDLENMDTSLTVDDIIKGLEWYPPNVNFLSKQKRAMRRSD